MAVDGPMPDWSRVDPNITRVEVIDDTGRAFVRFYETAGIRFDVQDEGRTLKVFAKTPKVVARHEDLVRFLSTDGWALRSRTESVDVCVMRVDGGAPHVAHVPRSSRLADYARRMREATQVVRDHYDWTESELWSMVAHGDMREAE